MLFIYPGPFTSDSLGQLMDFHLYANAGEIMCDID